MLKATSLLLHTHYQDSKTQTHACLHLFAGHCDTFQLTAGAASNSALLQACHAGTVC